MKAHFLIFATRWLGNSLVLALITAWPDSGLSLSPGIVSIFIAGLVVTLVNAVLRPILILAALPLLSITLGFFTLTVNYAVIFLSDKFYGGFAVEGFFWGLAAGLAVAAINYLITVFLSETD